SFNDSSISNIIEKAEIPRGSFYQYFNDLKDFYKYIIGFIADKKLEFFNQSFGDMGSLDTFKMIRELYRLGIKFAYDNPKIAAIGNYFASENDDLKNEIYENFEEKSRQFFVNLIEAGKAKGDINPEVDSQTVARILYFINLSITDEFLDDLNLSDIEAAELDDYYNFIDRMIFILKHGIA
ncbi:MAG: TetR/AcrR family transcriptional regulator, partial [Halarsenatibacteraceae bacterium]